MPHRSSQRLRLLRAVSVALLLGPRLAEAAEGQILRIEGPDLFVDIGASEGLSLDDRVSLYRVVELPDPRSGAVVRELFPAGEATVLEVGAQLSRLRRSPGGVGPLAVGDVARSPDRAPRPVVTTLAGAAPSAPQAAPGPWDAGELGALVELVSAEPALERRRELWQRFVQAYPQHPASPAAQREIAWLDAQIAAAAQASAQPASKVDRGSKAATPPRVVAPSRAAAGAAVPVLLLHPPADLQAATLVYRALGATTFEAVPMRRRASGEWVGEIPAGAFQGGVAEYNVRLLDGRAERGLPSDDGAPREITFIAPPVPPPVRDRSQVRFAYDYVDFYHLSGVDQYSAFEGSFLYRVDKGVLYAVSVGSGYLDGVGADTQRVDAAGTLAAQQALTRPVGFKYGDVELEFRLRPGFAVIGRVVAGVATGGVNGGAAGRVRLGPEEGTNLMLGVSAVGQIGQAYTLDLSWDTVERLPMRAGVELTNQPGVSQEDYGVRLLTELRYEVTDAVQVGGRLGYQLRNIEHAGPSFGGVLVFGW